MGYSNFSFLQKDFPEIYEWGKKAERSYVVDSDLCVSALQIQAELLISNIFEMENIYCSSSTHFDRIETLQEHYERNWKMWDDWSAWDDMYDFLHTLRKMANGIKHEGKHCTKENARIFLKNSLALCCWLQKKYGSAVIVPDKFYEPIFSQQTLPQEIASSTQKKSELQATIVGNQSHGLPAESKRSVKIERKPETSVSVKSYFESNGFEVIDKRISGGCLWVVGNEDVLRSYVKEVEKYFQVKGTFCAGGRATSYRAGWFTKTKK